MTASAAPAAWFATFVPAHRYAPPQRFPEPRMPRTLAVLMDPIAGIQPKKDTTLAMLLEAQRRGYALSYMRQGDLAVRDGAAWARLAPLAVRDDPHDWFTLG